MKASSLDRRESLLEAKRSDVDGEETRAFLAELRAKYEVQMGG